MMTYDSPLIKYGTLLAAVLTAGFSGGVFGCHLWDDPEKNKCSEFRPVGIWIVFVLAALTLVGTIKIMSSQEMTTTSNLIKIVISALSVGSMMASSGLWGCHTCGGPKSTLMMIASFAMSSLTMLSLFYQVVYKGGMMGGLGSGLGSTGFGSGLGTGLGSGFGFGY